MNKTTKIKKRLKPLLSLNRKYKTTYKDIKKYFNILNTGIFKNKLIPFNEIVIKNLKYQKTMGQVIIEDFERKGTRNLRLEMNISYDNKKDFLETLAHEMVHLYQFTRINDTGNHNKHFYNFRPLFKKIGLTL
jgi:hypothetical protein